jgi:hypothetical protein
LRPARALWRPGRVQVENMNYIFEVVEEISHGFALGIGEDIVVVYF